MSDTLHKVLLSVALICLALALTALWYSRSLGAEVRLLEREGVRTTAEITRKWIHVPSGTDSDGREKSGIPSHYLYYSFADPMTGELYEDRAKVSRATWDAFEVGQRHDLLVARDRPEVNSLFGTTGLGRASRQLDGLATWLGLVALICLALDYWLRRRARAQG
jgi:hypothetical protein